jgi:H+/Cl- antiporter ClcA
MNDLGKLLMVAGGLLLVVGAVLVLLGRANFPLGRLPGDIVYRGKNTTVYFPLVTSLLLSVVLSIVVYFLDKWKK